MLFCLALDDESLRGAPSMGRITGSASIETLVRVGLEKVKNVFFNTYLLGILYPLNVVPALKCKWIRI